MQNLLAMGTECRAQSALANTGQKVILWLQVAKPTHKPLAPLFTLMAWLRLSSDTCLPDILIGPVWHIFGALLACHWSIVAFCLDVRSWPAVQGSLPMTVHSVVEKSGVNQLWLDSYTGVYSRIN